ncbi:MAG: hypothetical protein AAFQ09_06570 [Pseudomonadota bacterium]
MGYKKYVLACLIMVVSGFGGGSSSADGSESTSSPMPTPGGGGGSQQLSDVLDLSSTEVASFTNLQRSRLVSFDVYNASPVADMSELIASQISGSARYSGSIMVRLGDSDEFLAGETNMLIGFNAGTMSGNIDNLTFTGPGSQGRATTPALDSLTLTPTNFSGASLQGTITGTFDEGGFLSISPPDDQHTVDATFDAVFVDALVGDANTEMVASVTGTITSTDDGVRTLEGIMEGESGF